MLCMCVYSMIFMLTLMMHSKDIHGYLHHLLFFVGNTHRQTNIISVMIRLNMLIVFFLFFFSLVVIVHNKMPINCDIFINNGSTAPLTSTYSHHNLRLRH